MTTCTAATGPVTYDYLIGDKPTITATFTDSLNEDMPVDPTAVFANILRPDGTLSELQYGVDSEVIRDAEGVYKMDIDLNAAGDWHIYVFSTGVGQAAQRCRLRVRDAEARSN